MIWYWYVETIIGYIIESSRQNPQGNEFILSWNLLLLFCHESYCDVLCCGVNYCDYCGFNIKKK